MMQTTSGWPLRMRLKPHPSKHKYLLHLVQGAGASQLANDLLHLAELGAMFKLGLLSDSRGANVKEFPQAAETAPERLAVSPPTRGDPPSHDSLGVEMKDALLAALHAAPTAAPGS